MPSSLRDPFAICFIFLARVRVIAGWTAPLFARGTKVLSQLCLPVQQAHRPAGIAHTSVSHIAIPARLLGLVYIDVIHAHGAQRQGLQAGRQPFHGQTAAPSGAGRRAATVHFLARRPGKARGALASAGLAIAESIGGALHQSVHVLGNLVVGTIVLRVVPDNGSHRRANWTGPRGAVGQEVVGHSARLVFNRAEALVAGTRGRAVITTAIAAAGILLATARSDHIRLRHRGGVGVKELRLGGDLNVFIVAGMPTDWD